MSSDEKSSQVSMVSNGIRATVFSMVVSTVLAAIKILAGLIGNSYALIADGFESLLDIFGSFVVIGSLRFSVRPASSRFPYGFGRIEPLAALMISTVLLAAAVGITIQSIREILTPHHTPETFTLFILIVVVLAKETMFRLLNRTGHSLNSSSIQADAWHHRSDSLTSLAAFIGITIAIMGGPGYESADDWAALFASAIIAFNGARLFRSSFNEIIDEAPSPELEEIIRSISLSIDDVLSIDKCRVRKSGLFYFVEIHIELDPSTTVLRGHHISHQVKDVLLASELQLLDVVVHIEPASH